MRKISDLDRSEKFTKIELIRRWEKEEKSEKLEDEKPENIP